MKVKHSLPQVPQIAKSSHRGVNRIYIIHKNIQFQPPLEKDKSKESLQNQKWNILALIVWLLASLKYTYIYYLIYQ